MAPNRFMTDLDFTKTQIAVYVVVILLSVQELNPISILCHALPLLQPWHMACLAGTLLVYVVLSELKQVLYFGVKVFFHSILSIFFSTVEVIGLENIPRHGPVIFTINHANQFIDAVTVLSTCQHKISYLMAEVSFRRRIIGDIAWAMEVVPVKRAQDEATRGTGNIVLRRKPKKSSVVEEGGEESGEGGGVVVESVTGTETETESDHNNKHQQQSEHDDADLTKRATSFKTAHLLEIVGHEGTTQFLKELTPGDKIRPLTGTAHGFKVLRVESDSLVVVDGTGCPENIPVLPAAAAETSNDNGKEDSTPASPPQQPCSFDVLKKVDTADVFEKVLEKLASGGAVGIFPEGGSHDRTDLLPLKVGIALIAYGALDKDNLLVPIVPVGLNYFRAHRWRGKAVIEYGRPTTIDPTTLPQFQAGGASKRAVCDALLDDIQRCMKSVLVSTPDYDTLQLIHTARRLWQRKKGTLDTAEKQDLTRRFAQGYQLLLQHPNPPEEWLQMQRRINDYRNELKDLGIRDYQVTALQEDHYEQELYDMQNPNQVLSFVHVTYQILHLLFLICVAAIPFLLINFPVGVLAGWYAERRRQRALARSKVKIKGYDVMLTEKVVFCIVAVPTLWIFYGILLKTMTDMDAPTLALCLFCLPLFAYMGIVAADAGMVDWQDVRYLCMRLVPSARKRLAALPKQRKQLQDDLRAFIKDVGPKYLGDVYYSKDKVDWAALWEKERLLSPRESMVSSSSAAEESSAAAEEQEQEAEQLQQQQAHQPQQQQQKNESIGSRDPKKDQ